MMKLLKEVSPGLVAPLAGAANAAPQTDAGRMGGADIVDAGMMDGGALMSGPMLFACVLIGLLILAVLVRAVAALIEYLRSDKS